MKKIIIGILSAVVAISATAFSANAQAIRTWVSGVGDDANPCSRAAPCKTFAGAISKTADGGEISCLDSAGFGAVTITKSISVICEGAIGGITAAGTSAFIINAGANAVVVLKGLDIEGGGSTVLGINGIRFLAGGALHVEDVIIRGFHAGSPNGNGILFAPSAGSAELTVRNTTITNNGAGTSGGGIQIKPTGSGGVKAVIEDTLLGNNGAGIVIDGTATTGSNSVTIRNSAIAGNSSYGLLALDNAGGITTTNVVFDGSTSSDNGTAGVGGNGSNTTVRLKNSTVTGNANGIAAAASSKLISQGGNTVVGNRVDGAFTQTLPPQ